jgi:hypothetical protein
MLAETTETSKTYFDMSAAEQAAHHAHMRQMMAHDWLRAATDAAEIERTIKKGEAEIERMVADAKDAEGKPICSNADKRRAEFLICAEADPVLRLAHEQLDKTQLQARQWAIDADYHRDMARILCAFAEAQKAEAQP